MNERYPHPKRESRKNRTDGRTGDDVFSYLVHFIGKEEEPDSVTNPVLCAVAHPPRPFPVMPESAQNTIVRTTARTMSKNTMVVQIVDAAPVPT